MATTASIPTPAHETSLHRVSEYPVVKDTLSQAYSLVQKNSYSANAYSRLESLSQSIISVLSPRLPLETVDGYANGALDFVEAKFPAVKTETSVLVEKVRAPADSAVGIAKTYADGIQSRLSPVTAPIYARIAQTQETLSALQTRLSEATASLPRDKASATEAMNSIFREVESATASLTTHVKELPHQAQAAATPLLNGLSEAATHIKGELSKKDVPLSQKAANVLAYSQSQISPILSSFRDVILKKKEAIEEEVSEVPVPNGVPTPSE